MNKYTIRRFIFGVITAPVVILAYGTLWVWLLFMGAADNGMFIDNAVLISIVWVVFMTFSKQIMKLIDKGLDA